MVQIQLGLYQLLEGQGPDPVHQRLHRLLRVLLVERHHIVPLEKPPVRHHPIVVAPLEVEVGLVQEDLCLDLVYQIPVVGALVDQRVDEVRDPWPSVTSSPCIWAANCLDRASMQVLTGRATMRYPSASEA